MLWRKCRFPGRSGARSLGTAERSRGELSLELAPIGKNPGRSRDCENPSAVSSTSRDCENSSAVSSRSRIICELKACGVSRDLGKGKHLHGEALRRGFMPGIYVENTLTDMYAKCSSMVDARRIFDGMEALSVVSWNVLLMGYVENGEPELAWEIFSSCMDCEPDGWTLVAAIKACSSLAEKEEAKDSFQERTIKGASLKRGMSVLSKILCCGDVFISTSLVDMYAKCGSLDDAQRVFELMPCHSVVSWNSLILGYVQNDEGSMALLLFSGMRQRGCLPNALTYTAVLKACSSLAAIEEGKLIEGKFLKIKALEKGRALHALAAKAGYDLNLPLGCTLVDMYAKCGSLVEARRVFERIDSKPVASWNAVVLGYTENSEEHEALELFSRMQKEGYTPDSRTFVAALKACTGLAGKEARYSVEGQRLKVDSLGKAMYIHSRATGSGCDKDIYVQNTLVDTYAKCGSVLDARHVFDRMIHHGVVSWTALILGYVEVGEEELGLELFSRMKDHGCQPNGRTFVAAVKACMALALKEEGRKVEGRRKLVKMDALHRGFQVHTEASASSCDLDSFVASSLVNMYAICGSLADARNVFDKIPKPDRVLWNVLMLGYVENGESELALHFYFSVMEHMGCQPDSSTFVAALKACAAIANLKAANSVHGDINRLCGLERNGEGLLNSLVDVYGKCGSMRQAQQAFDLISSEDLQIGTWNALLVGFGRQGDAEQVFNAFQSLQNEGFKPDGITMNCVLTGCSHAGLIEKGLHFFKTMEHIFGISPDVEHYTCMVDMLARANKLNAALEVVKTIPFKVDAVIWMTLLSSCWKWKNLAIGKIAFDALLQLGDNEKIEAAHNLMANLFWNADEHDV